MITFDQAALVAGRLLVRELSGYAENDEAYLFSMKDSGPVSEGAYVSKKSGKGHVMYFDEYCDYVHAGLIKAADWKPMPAN